MEFPLAAEEMARNTCLSAGARESAHARIPRTRDSERLTKPIARETLSARRLNSLAICTQAASPKESSQMTGRRAIVGLCMLCALAFSAFAAQGAAAATKGTTAFTCKKEASGSTFKTEHCKASDGAGTAYGHVAIAQDTTTELELTNAKTNAATTGSTPAQLHSVFSGVELELEATTVSGSGSMFNRKDATTGEHFIEGEGTITFSGVKVTKPAGKGCKVFTDNAGVKGEEGVVHTNVLTATSKPSSEQGDNLKYTPKEGQVFAAFIIEGCEGNEIIKAFNKTYEVKGSIKSEEGDTSGATAIFNRGTSTTGTTGQGTLTLNGQKAGINGKGTYLGRDKTLEEKVFTPLTATTVETP
jgi:hypothetical protein